MATAYKADTYADNQIVAPWGVGQTWIRPFQFNIATGTANTGFIINDTLALCPIPYKDAGVGVLMVDFHVELPSLDGGNSVRVSLGDTNGTAGAFQAVWYSAQELGSNVQSILTGTLAIGGTHAATTILAKATGTAAELPKQYSISQLYTNYVAFPTIDFMLKVTTAPNTATTTGTIRGWLMLQTLNSSAVTWA
jgi:hypothetical protein